jgi:hypothetical protein
MNTTKTETLPPRTGWCPDCCKIVELGEPAVGLYYCIECGRRVYKSEGSQLRRRAAELETQLREHKV